MAHEALTEATEFIKVIEKRTGLKIACIEEIAYRLGFVDSNQFKKLAQEYGNGTYANYLNKIINY